MLDVAMLARLRSHRSLYLRPLALLGMGALLLGNAGCSSPTDDSTDGNQARTSVAGMIGQHLYICEDGTKVDVDFLGDGLTLDLTILPDGETRRLISPGTGVPFFGDGINLQIVSGKILILRPDIPAKACRRVKTDASQDKLHPN